MFSVTDDLFNLTFDVVLAFTFIGFVIPIKSVASSKMLNNFLFPIKNLLVCSLLNIINHKNNSRLITRFQEHILQNVYFVAPYQ